MNESTRSHSALLDVPIDALTMDEAVAHVVSAIHSRRRLLIGVVNAGKLVHMSRDASLRYSVLGADMILADGMGAVWACGLLGEPLPERVTGIDLMERILSAGNERGYRIYFLGAAKDVLQATVARVNAEFPGVVVAGQHHGYFHANEERRLVEEIRASRADVLLVAMSSPKKEEFLARWAEVMGVPVLHGVGGAFDVFAGKVRRAPRLWQRMGLEWLYRVLQEPGRLWKRYLTTNLAFAALVVGAWRAKRRGLASTDGRLATASS